jgi:hypothetical protein
MGKGGSVATANFMKRYDEPQTRYTVTNARSNRVRDVPNAI